MSFQQIKEYLNIPAGTPGTLLIPKLILPNMIDEVEKALVPRELARNVWGPGQLANQGNIFTVNLETPSTGKVRLVAEGAAIPLDQQAYSTVTFTFAKYGISVRITREMQEDSQFELLMRNIRMAGRRFAENETALIITALDGAANTVSGGAAITVANITTGILNVHNSDFEATDMLIGMEVLQDLQNIDTFVEYQKVGNTEMLQRGFLGNVFGMQVSKFSTNAAPTTTYAKYAYIIDRAQAYGIAIKRDITVENYDLASYDMSGVAITQRIDVELFRSSAVCKITTS